MNHEKASRLDFVIATVALLLPKYVYQNKCVVSESEQKCGCLCCAPPDNSVCPRSAGRREHAKPERAMILISDYCLLSTIFFSFLFQTKQQFRILCY